MNFSRGFLLGDMMNEQELQQLVQIMARENNCLLMRNNSGAHLDQRGALVRYGLGNISKAHNDKCKSSDLIGIQTILITPDMVGKTIGVFVAVEMKAPNWSFKGDKREVAQENFIKLIRNYGGKALFVNSLDEFKQIIKN